MISADTPAAPAATWTRPPAPVPRLDARPAPRPSAKVRAATGLELEIVDRETEARLAAVGSASLADSASAKLLGVKAGSPLLAIERLTLGTEGRPLELLRAVYLPDYFRLSISLRRQHS